MAIDSQAKRFAMLGFASAIVRLVVVDAEVSTSDRLSYLALYNGITLEEPGGGVYIRHNIEVGSMVTLKIVKVV